LRIRLHVSDLARRQELTALLEAAGHVPADDAPDVELCDLAPGTTVPGESEAPVIVLTNRSPPGDPPAGVLSREVSARQLDLAVRAVAAGLLVRMPGVSIARGVGAAAGFGAAPGFGAASGFDAPDEAPPPLTPRETEILSLVGEGMSNKAVARRLGISVHTVKFHLEALFAKLDATSRAEAVAKGLRGGILEI
jgi:two-component system, NarL family, nitrate/nitrite response regulator NarL